MLFITCSTSCTKDEIQTCGVENQSETLANVEVTDGGYLSFPNQVLFDSYIEELRDSESSVKTGVTRSNKFNLGDLSGFKSIANIQEQYYSTRASIAESSDDDDEEMTLDEFNALKAEDILVDPVLTQVMDTTLRVQIGDRLYKITEYGTFYAPKDNIKELDDEVSQFTAANIENSLPNETIELNNGVVFVNTKDNIYIEEPDLELVVDEYNETRAMGALETLNLHKPYNTEDYQWKNHSVWQKMWDSARGKDVDRERYFDKKHRIQVEVFSVNYLFYKSCGISVKMQRRKRFLGFKHWVKDDCEDLAIGFNCVAGVLSFNNPANYSSITPSYSAQWGRFTSVINNQVGSFVFNRLKRSEILKDWVNFTVENAYIILPEIRLKKFWDKGSEKYLLDWPKRSDLQRMYDVPYELAASFVKNMNGKYLDSIRKKIVPEDPRIAYLVWGNSDLEFNKSKPYISGVVKYGECRAKTVRFNRSFGVNINNFIVTPFIPTDFKIEYFDGFGAVKYQGRWLGIRMVGNKKVW